MKKRLKRLKNCFVCVNPKELTQLCDSFSVQRYQQSAKHLTLIYSNFVDRSTKTTDRRVKRL